MVTGKPEVRLDEAAQVLEITVRVHAIGAVREKFALELLRIDDDHDGASIRERTLRPPLRRDREGVDDRSSTTSLDLARWSMKREIRETPMRQCLCLRRVRRLCEQQRDERHAKRPHASSGDHSSHSRR